MSQYDFGIINPATTTGSDLATVLQNWRDAVLSNHSGTVRPAYIKAGQIWINTATTNNWVVNLYDGSADIPLGYVNTTETSAGFLTRSNVTTKTASATIQVSERDMLVGVTASTANLVMTLPTATTANNGFKIRFQKRDNTAFSVTVLRSGTDLINGLTSYVLTQRYDMVEMVSDGVNSWYAYGGIVDGTITAAKLVDNIITTAKIADGAVTNTKLTPSVTGFLVPSGAIMQYAGLTAPPSWLLCNGAVLSRTTYAALYAALGGASSPWGQGDGSTTFNLPDFRGRVPAGLDNMGGISANRLRATRSVNISTISQSTAMITVTCASGHGLDVGNTVIITGAGNAAFNGTWTVSSVRITGAEATRPSRVFTINSTVSQTIAAVAGGTLTIPIENAVDGSVLGAAGGADIHTLNIGEIPNHTHYVPVAGVNATWGSILDFSAADVSFSGSGTDKAANSWTGGGGPHNNVQPTVVVNYIIKT